MTTDPEGRDDLIRRTGQLAVPVVVVGGEVIVGFDRARLTALLEIQG